MTVRLPLDVAIFVNAFLDDEARKDLDDTLAEWAKRHFKGDIVVTFNIGNRKLEEVGEVVE